MAVPAPWPYPCYLTVNARLDLKQEELGSYSVKYVILHISLFHVVTCITAEMYLFSCLPNLL